MTEEIILAFASAANLLIGLFVFLNNTKSHTHRAFFFLTSTLVIWSITNYFSLNPVIFDQLTWARLVLFFAALLNLAVYLTFAVFPNVKFPSKHRARRGLIVFTILVMGLTLTPLVFSRLETVEGSISPVPGPAIPIFALHTFLLLSTAIATIYKKYRSATGQFRRQMQYVLLGIFTTFSLIIFTNFVLASFLRNTYLLPLAPAYTLVFSISFAYAIMRTSLFNVRAIVARSVAYVLLLISMAGFYGGAGYGLTSLLFANQSASASQVLVNASLAIVLAFTFQPLRRFFERITDRIFFRDRYDSQEVLNTIGKIVASELLLDRLLDKTLSTLCHRLRIDSAQFLVMDGDKLYKTVTFGNVSLERVPSSKELGKLNHPLLVADTLTGGERKRILDKHGWRVSQTLRTKDQFVGYLLLGDKRSGDIYSTQDLDLLKILSNELSISIVNALAYEKIAEFNVTLQRKVAEATGRLRVANRNLKALDKAKDEFISMASHQLRTPLTAIKGYLSMLIEGDAGKLRHTEEELVDPAYGSAERMNHLISDLLNVSRLSAGRFVINRAPTNMVQMIKDEVRQLINTADGKHLALKFKPPTEAIPSLNIDEGKTRQVVMNFIDNAIYYTEQGSVTVAVAHENDMVRVTVSDTGIGVPDAAKKKLFTKFFRAENAKQTRPDGTGLGLYLARRVIEDQGGQIIFHSEEGKGSTFGFELPVKIHRAEPMLPRGTTRAR